MAYTFTPTQVNLTSPGSALSLEPWRRRMGEIGSEASQGAINNFERSSVDLANQTAANETRGLRGLSNQNTGFANTTARSALSNQFRLENAGQGTAAQNALANSFETQRQNALGIDLNAQQQASAAALAEFQNIENQRQFNENFGLQSANNMLAQQTQIQNNELGLNNYGLNKLQHEAQMAQFAQTFGLTKEQFEFKVKEYIDNKTKLESSIAPGPGAVTPPNEAPISSEPTGGSSSTTTSSGGTSATGQVGGAGGVSVPAGTEFVTLPNGQRVPASAVPGSAAPQSGVAAPTSAPSYESQVQAYVGAKGLLGTLGKQTKSWEAFTQKAAKQLNIPALEGYLTPDQIKDIKSKYNLAARKR